MGRHSAPDHAQPSPTVGVHSPQFRRLTAAWAMSLLGDGVRLVALPIVAALLTRDPLAVTAVAAAELLPWLFLAIPAGALVDRWDARRVVVAAHLVRAGITGALVVALASGTAGVLVLCAAAFTLTVAETFADGANQLLLVELSGPDDLVPANVRFRSVETLALTLVGPLAGGVLVAVDPAVAFAVDGATFVLAAVMVWTLPARRAVTEPEHEPTEVGLRRMWNEVREGVSVLLATPALRVLVVIMVWTSLASGAVNAVSVLFALEVLGLSVQVVPLLVVAQALGVLLGARLVQPVVARSGEGLVMLAALGLVGAPYLLIGLVAEMPVIFPAYVVSGVGFAWWNVLAASRRQRICPPQLLGRVSNASRAATWGAMPLGAVLGGVLAEATGLHWVFVVGGGLIILTGLVQRRALLVSALPSSPVRECAPA